MIILQNKFNTNYNVDLNDATINTIFNLITKKIFVYSLEIILPFDDSLM